MGLGCGTCSKPKERCWCQPKSTRNNIPLGPRPTSRSADSAPRVSTLPSNLQSAASRVSPAPSVRVATTAAPALERTPTNYSNITYRGHVELPYNNTGPQYDPSTAGLSAPQGQLRTALTGIGQRDLANRYAQLELADQKVQGNHSDLPTYGRDSLYRTGSDMVTHDAYHDKAHMRMLQDATRAVGPAKEAKGASIKSKSPDSMPHVRVVQTMRRAQDAHLEHGNARMTYMENHPNGLDNARSHGTHVAAVRNSLQSAASHERDIAQQERVAHRKESEALAEPWSVDPGGGAAYHARPPSVETMISASSRVSSSRSGGSGPAPAFASGSGIQRRCEARDARGSQCPRLTTGHRCGLHRD